MKILVVDTETTGKWNFKAAISHKSQPDLTQLAVQKIGLRRVDGATVFDPGFGFDTLVKPSSFHSGQPWNLHPEAAEITGLSREKCEDEGVPLADALRTLYVLSQDADLIVAYNADFDRNVLHRALWRVYGKLPTPSRLVDGVLRKGASVPYKHSLGWWDAMKPLTNIVRVVGPMAPDGKENDGCAFVKRHGRWVRMPPWYGQYFDVTEKPNPTPPPLVEMVRDAKKYRNTGGYHALYSGGLFYRKRDDLWAQIRDPIWKWPSLDETHRFITGRGVENAHDAMADVNALVEVIRWCWEKGLVPGSESE